MLTIFIIIKEHNEFTLVLCYTDINIHCEFKRKIKKKFRRIFENCVN